MDPPVADLIQNKDHVSEEQRDNKQNESRAQGDTQTPVTERFRLTVEPVLLLMIVAETVSFSVIQNFFEFKSCRVILNMSHTECLNMTSELEAKVQPITADLLMWKSLIESVLPAILSFFIGPWSDVNGRKSLFVVSICGFLCYHVAWTVLSLVPSPVPLKYYLLASLPRALTGGWVVIFVASYCYLVDITRIENRTYRIGLMECSNMLGVLLGYFLTPRLYQYGFVVAFGASSIFCFVCLSYVCCFLRETIIPERGVNYNIFNWQHVYTMFSTTFYKRPHNGRSIILLLVLTFFINIVVFLGETSITQLWLKLQFHFTLSDFTTFQEINVTIMGLGSFAGLWFFSSKLRLPDLPLATVIIGTRVVSSVMLGFAAFPWQVYASTCVGMFSGAVGPLLRATISKIAPKHEIGKVFALIASLEATAPLGAAPLYTFVYNAAIGMAASSMVFLMSAFLYTLTMLFIIIIMIIQWRCPAMEYSSINDGDIPA